MNNCGKLIYLKDGAVVILSFFMTGLVIYSLVSTFFSLWGNEDLPYISYLFMITILYLVFYFKQSSNIIYYTLGITCAIYSLFPLEFDLIGNFPKIKELGFMSISILISMSFFILVYVKSICANSNKIIEDD